MVVRAFGASGYARTINTRRRRVTCAWPIDRRTVYLWLGTILLMNIAAIIGKHRRRCRLRAGLGEGLLSILRPQATLFGFDPQAFHQRALADTIGQDELITLFQGHLTDVFVSAQHVNREYNEKLGLDRAESVKRYLYEEHQIPLHRISVISYGAEKPIAPNKTKEGRAKNRRVQLHKVE